jgi:hypothetical protein
VTLRVMTRLEQPFVTLKKRSSSSVAISKGSLAPPDMQDVPVPPGGNERFEVRYSFRYFRGQFKIYLNIFLKGFCIDLLEAIAQLVGFNYVIDLVPDNSYGALNVTTQEWNGLVRGKEVYFQTSY